jgi:hypothetical protein
VRQVQNLVSISYRKSLRCWRCNPAESIRKHTMHSDVNVSFLIYPAYSTDGRSTLHTLGNSLYVDWRNPTSAPKLTINKLTPPTRSPTVPHPTPLQKTPNTTNSSSTTIAVPIGPMLVYYPPSRNSSKRISPVSTSLPKHVTMTN